jgi:polar amino acid transport system substrate-binding protein
MRLFDDQAAMTQEVLNGKAHVSVGDAPTPFWEVLAYPDTLYLPLGKEAVYKLPTNFAVRKGDLDWLNYLNNWILYRTNDGWLQERYEYYFTTKDWESQIK